MPKKIHECAKKLQKQGKDESSSWAICTASIKNKDKKKKGTKKK